MFRFFVGRSGWSSLSQVSRIHGHLRGAKTGVIHPNRSLQIPSDDGNGKSKNWHRNWLVTPEFSSSLLGDENEQFLVTYCKDIQLTTCDIYCPLAALARSGAWSNALTLLEVWIGGLHKWGYPKMDDDGKILFKWLIGGYPHLWKPPFGKICTNQ